MSTPTYLGKGQPLANSSGLLGRLGSYFGGGGTPAYAGEAQPSAVSRGGLLAGASPAYAAAAARPASAASGSQEAAPSCVTEGEAEPPAPVMIDPEALAAGQIAIVIPR